MILYVRKTQKESKTIVQYSSTMQSLVDNNYISWILQSIKSFNFYCREILDYVSKYLFSNKKNKKTKKQKKQKKQKNKKKIDIIMLKNIYKMIAYDKKLNELISLNCFKDEFLDKLKIDNVNINIDLVSAIKNNLSNLMDLHTTINEELMEIKKIEQAKIYNYSLDDLIYLIDIMKIFPLAITKIITNYSYYVNLIITHYHSETIEGHTYGAPIFLNKLYAIICNNNKFLNIYNVYTNKLMHSIEIPLCKCPNEDYCHLYNITMHDNILIIHKELHVNYTEHTARYEHNEYLLIINMDSMTKTLKDFGNKNICQYYDSNLGSSVIEELILLKNWLFALVSTNEELILYKIDIESDRFINKQVIHQFDKKYAFRLVGDDISLYISINSNESSFDVLYETDLNNNKILSKHFINDITLSSQEFEKISQKFCYNQLNKCQPFTTENFPLLQPSIVNMTNGILYFSHIITKTDIIIIIEYNYKTKKFVDCFFIFFGDNDVSPVDLFYYDKNTDQYMMTFEGSLDKICKLQKQVS